MEYTTEQIEEQKKFLMQAHDIIIEMEKTLNEHGIQQHIKDAMEIIHGE